MNSWRVLKLILQLNILALDIVRKLKFRIKVPPTSVNKLYQYCHTRVIVGNLYFQARLYSSVSGHVRAFIQGI